MDAPLLDYETWIDTLRPVFGHYNHTVDPESFRGRASVRSVYGFGAVDLSANGYLSERTRKDIRRDNVDDYYIGFQVAGTSTMIQNDEATTLAAGDAVLVDSSKPVTWLSPNRSARWLALQLPRPTLIPALGYEPQGSVFGGGKTLAGRLLFQLVLDTVENGNSMSAAADNHMKFAVYDLLGALFAQDDPLRVCFRTDKLFSRICGVIRDHFADPSLGPYVVAAEVGISLRYLQQLFQDRGTTCNRYMQSVRLEQAERLLRRRADRPLTEISYACGFSDYNHFCRRFRDRFGTTPSAYAEAQRLAACRWNQPSLPTK